MPGTHLHNPPCDHDTEPVLAADTAHFVELAAALNSFPAKCDGFDKRPRPLWGLLMALTSQDLLLSSNRVLEQLKKVNLVERVWNRGNKHFCCSSVDGGS